MTGHTYSTAAIATIACCCLLLAMGGGGIAAAGGARTADPSTAATGSGLPVPRFASLKSDRVNLRAGPGTEYPASWVFRRAGLPIEIIKEFDAWRQIRDSEGVTGWVLQSLLSGRRTAVVLPWDLKPDAPPPQAAIRTTDSESARPAAIVEAGVIASVIGCDGRWCYVAIDEHKGYIEQKKLWGIYDGEILK